MLDKARLAATRRSLQQYRHLCGIGRFEQADLVGHGQVPGQGGWHVGGQLGGGIHGANAGWFNAGWRSILQQNQCMTSTPLDKDALRAKYLAERDKRLRPDGNDQYIRLQGAFAHYQDDPYTPRTERAPKADHVTFAFIGGGFGGLCTAARLVEAGVRDVRIIENGGDFGGDSEVIVHEWISDVLPELDPKWPAQVAPTLDANFARLQGQDNQHIKAGAGLFVMAIESGQSAGASAPNIELCPTLNCNHEQSIIFNGNASAAQSMNPCGVSPTLDVSKSGGVMVFDPNQITSKTNRSIPTPELCHTMPATEQAPIIVFPTLTASNDPSRSPQSQEVKNQIEAIFLTQKTIRRIIPVEAERLQGFPDNYTKINDKTADGPRYKALGNSMAVPVMRWIGERINEHK